MYQDIFNEAQAMQEELTAWRHALHGMPELGLELPKTSAYVQARLTEMGVPFTTLVDGNSVVAQLGQGEHCLLLRADMDALPMREESGVDFASTNGCMHACGHDLHAAALLGAAKLLKAHEAELRGTIKLFFQPAEETFSGAQAALKEGLLENPRVEAAVATHVASIAPVGLVGYGPTPAAAVYGFKITLTGKGTHGAMPDLGIDPINTAVHIYLALQELIARECPADKEVTLTIGQISAGTTFNIIPETAVMQGTLRVFDNDLRKQMIRRIGEVVEHVAAAYRTKAEIEVLGDIPPLVCDPAFNERLVQVYKEMAPQLMLLEGVHTTASEDFAFFSDHVPTAMFLIGAQIDDGTPIYNQHNPKVRFNDKALPVEAAVYACAALNWQRDAK
ncbi:MAG: M20 family metallopeptidase [Peptococcaceae bacterium]|nr:M20 family metallopeptidase [Peptococcaceae bacterium]